MKRTTVGKLKNLLKIFLNTQKRRRSSLHDFIQDLFAISMKYILVNTRATNVEVSKSDDTDEKLKDGKCRVVCVDQRKSYGDDTRYKKPTVF